MPSTAPAPSKPVTAAGQPMTADQARIAWATAGRDSELSRWRDLYDLAVPRPAASEDRPPGLDLGPSPAG